LGGKKSIKVDFRLVSATNEDLEEMVRQGRFREDLYYRIHVVPIFVPALRERAEDIQVLADYFVSVYSAANGFPAKHIADDAIAALKRYAWPGNVRELRNVVERLLLLASGELVTAEDVRMALPQLGATGSAQGAAGAGASGSLAERVEAFEKEVLLRELKQNSYHMTNVAKALGLERSHLYKKCQQLGIDLRDLRKTE
jgi:DNA-binding NtrC family response regulator